MAGGRVHDKNGIFIQIFMPRYRCIRYTYAHNIFITVNYRFLSFYVIRTINWPYNSRYRCFSFDKIVYMILNM